jgi:hypothetical protein
MNSRLSKDFQILHCFHTTKIIRRSLVPQSFSQENAAHVIWGKYEKEREKKENKGEI